MSGPGESFYFMHTLMLCEMLTIYNFEKPYFYFLLIFVAFTLKHFISLEYVLKYKMSL